MRTTLARVAAESKSPRSHARWYHAFAGLDLAARVQTRFVIPGMDKPICTPSDRRVKRFMLAPQSKARRALMFDEEY